MPRGDWKALSGPLSRPVRPLLMGASGACLAGSSAQRLKAVRRNKPGCSHQGSGAASSCGGS
eukprot:CAMPEP_0195571736 /NCGR_PEP_ID=MMETSP0814-20130614/4283_1 /TAXON_ID=97485 /ORGANISM="Prymnesium parvum, Strain Texoma1" /LENGTH=61 /DNA_ID=CAMNT_0040707399 /DNA_START=175 /DNA_END=356 /DNA_ORIENTATION=-